MKIYVKQIDEASLTAFVTGAAGASFSGQLNSYVQNGGYLGVNVVYSSGGFQIISGAKTFDASPTVPYSGGTGTAPSRLYVDNQITVATVLYQASLSGISGSIFNTGANLSLVKVTGSSGIQIANFTGLGNVSTSLVSGGLIGISGNSNDAINLSGRLFNTGANLSSVRVTGSSNIQTPNFTGMGGTLVIRSGDFVLISGGAGGAAAGNGDGINLSGNLFTTGANLSSVRVTGSNNIQVPNFTGMGGTLVIQSGDFVLISGAGAGGGSSVSVTGSNTIALPNFTGMGGTLIIQSGNFVLVSGGGGSTFVESNTFNITGTGTINITATSSGSMSNVYNNYSGTINTNPTILNGITGNFVNISFFFDEFNTATGLNLVEGFVSRDFTFTGYAVGAYVSGTHGRLSGAFYQRSQTNAKTQITPFSFESGMHFTGQGGFSQTISGMHRVGVDIFSLMTGITGISVGLFGVGY